MDLAMKASPLLGQRIRMLRKRQHLTQETLSLQLRQMGLDVSRSTLAKIEAGVRHVSVEELRALTKLRGTDFNFLLAE